MKPTTKSIIYNPPMDNGQRWVEHPADGLRFTGKAHDIAKRHDRWRAIDHTGWFTDDDGLSGETVCGLVYQLPAHKGTPVYVAAVSDACGNDGALIDFSETFDDEMEAAFRSDELARIYADKERDYRREENAKLQYEDITEQIESAWKDCREMCRGIRALNPGPELRKLLRKHVCSVRREVRQLRKDRAEFEWAIAR